MGGRTLSGSETPVTTPSGEWLAGHAAAKEQALSVAKMYGDEFAAQSSDAAHPLKQPEEWSMFDRPLLMASLEHDRIYWDTHTARMAAGHIAGVIAAMEPPGADVTIRDRQGDSHQGRRAVRTVTIEIRDHGTFIPACAVQAVPANEAERYLLRRCGYEFSRPAVILFRLNGDGQALSDPYAWTNRTMLAAHLYVTGHFDQLADGDVVDVQFVLVESVAPKLSERVTVPE
jgi:hypothetical protein